MEEKQNLPNHIVIVPDGNRRWAKKQGKIGSFGHKAGAENVQKILEKALEMKISYITFWGLSLSNLKRSQLELKILFSLFKKYFKKLANSKEVQQNRVRIRAFGRWHDYFPTSLRQEIEKLIKDTKDYNDHHLTFLLAYSGVDEMTDAIQKITKIKSQNFPNTIPLTAKDTGQAKIEINDKLIKENLWTKDLPPVDLVIRTGGEPHWSEGLMMWDVAEAGLFFTETFWPDFGPEEFKEVIKKFSKTERRLGR